MALQLLPNLLNDATHEQFDNQVLNSFRTQPSSNLLLATIVSYGGETLNQTYCSILEADQLLVQYPELQEPLAEAWSKKSFKDIRNLRIFRQPGRPVQTVFDPDHIVQETINRELERIRPFVQKFLLRDEPWDFWTPSSDDPRIAKHSADLRVPLVAQRPRLLLHDLGGSIVDPMILESVFARRNTYFVNASGSGKTRVLFEGLCKDWGFYFTCTANGAYGSRDLSNVLDAIPATSKDVTEEQVEIAFRGVHQLLAARFFLFRLFLQEAMKLTPDGSLDRYRAHWLYFQLRAVDITNTDILNDLTAHLSSATSQYLGVRASGILSKTRMNISNNYLSGRWYIVVDEAQRPAQLLRNENKWDIKMSQQRSILRDMVPAWEGWGDLILAGTDLSIKPVEDKTCSHVAKIAADRLWIRTGSFATRAMQADYIRRYLPPHILESESGQFLLQRMWSWLSGRHRFTATFLDLLLYHSLRSPHKLLDRYINHLTQMTPSDSPPFADEEPDLDDDLLCNLMETPVLDFSKIIEGRNITHQFGDIIYGYALHQQYAGLEEDGKEWVELGLARFVHHWETWSTMAIIDEPVVILAAIHQLNVKRPLVLKNCLVKSLSNNGNNGAKLEALLALYLAYALGRGVKLCDIFDFGKNIPQWATVDGVELVAFSRDGQFHKVDLSSSTLSNILRHGSMEAEDTVKWFQKPLTGICLPDLQLGPDIALFIRLPVGQVLCIIIQTKCRSLAALPKREDDSAVSTLEPSDFYKHKHLTDPKWASYRRDILDSSRKLGAIEDEQWFPDGLPVLRVLACYPEEPREQSEPVVLLNISRFLEITDNEALQINAPRAGAEGKECKRTFGWLPRFPAEPKLEKGRVALGKRQRDW